MKTPEAMLIEKAVEMGYKTINIESHDWKIAIAAIVAYHSQFEDRWIPVETRKPDDEQSVLVWCDPGPDRPNYTDGCMVDFWTHDNNGWESAIYVTHWKPLPLPPTPTV